MIIINILIFIFILGFLIFAHEFFHFIAAKKSGARVEEFCIGYPPRIYKKKKKRTLYSIGIIPLGGFVKIFGEDPREKGKDSFYGLSFRQRFWIISAGVISNFLIAILLFALVFSIGYPQAIEGKTPENAKDITIQIIFVAQNSPAEKADISIGDKIISLSSENTEIKPKEIEEIQKFTKENAGKEIKITLQRGDETLQKNIKPRKDHPENEGPMGIMLAKTGIIKYSLNEAFLMGIKTTYRYTKLTIWGIGQIIKNAIVGIKVPGLEFSGPVGIGNLFVKMADLGFVYIINFTAIISLGFAILNSLPFPALDGGRLLFLIIEKIKKSPIKPGIEALVNQIGFAILIIIMIVVTIKDIKGLF